MLKYARTTDPALIRSMLTHPKVFRWLFEDGASAEDFEPVISPNIWYIVALDDRKPVGMFVFEPRTSVKYVVALAIWPERWASAVPAFKGVVQYAFDMIPNMERIVGEVPSDNSHAMRLAKRAGFEMCGLERKSFMRGGELRDIRYLGASRDTWSPDAAAQDIFCVLCGGERRKRRKGQSQTIEASVTQEVQWQSVH